MLKIGIIGAENTHAAAIAKACNVNKAVRARVTMLWGETTEFARKAAETGQIPTIVKDWRKMLGQVDGIMIDHRHPKFHYEPAQFFLENKIPCFVDKPFTFTLAEARRLCDLARRKKTPVTSFSIIPHQKSYLQFMTAARALGPLLSLTTTGPVDLKSKYGGVFFYGIHQVDAMIELLGWDVDWVQVCSNGKNGTGVMAWRNGPVVSMNFISGGYHKSHWSAVSKEQRIEWSHENDPSPYLHGAKMFVRMFETGKEPYSHARLLAPVAVLEAMAKSIKTGKRIRMPKLD